MASRHVGEGVHGEGGAACTPRHARGRLRSRAARRLGRLRHPRADRVPEQHAQGERGPGRGDQQPRHHAMKAPFSRTRPVLDGFAAAAVATPMSLFVLDVVVAFFAELSQ